MTPTIDLNAIRASVERNGDDLQAVANELGLPVGKVHNAISRLRGKARMLPDPAPDGIEELDCVGVRAYNSLKRAGVHTIDQLCELTLPQLLALEFMNRRGAEQVIEALVAAGRSLSPVSLTQTWSPEAVTDPAPARCEATHAQTLAESQRLKR